MSLAAVRSQLSAIEKRLDALQGEGAQVEYLWSWVSVTGAKKIYAGDPASKARSIVEIAVFDADGAGASPRIFIDGRRVDYG